MLKEIIAGYISFAAIAQIIKDIPKEKLLYDHEYERILKVERNSVIIDIGAAKGSFILNNLGKVKMGIAIEPNPQYAKELLAMKKHNLRVIQKAAYNKKGNVKFRLNSYESAIMADNEVINVQTDTLDNILINVYDDEKLNFKFKFIDKIDFIKMDIEGSEIEALLGMKNTLEKTKKVVVSAYHKRDGKPTYLWVEKFLKNKGFNVVVTDDMLVHAWKD